MVVAALIAAFIAVFTNVQAQRATNTQLRIAEQGQITERYNAAITNLGSRSIDVRLGGIYALQRLMKDSPPDQPTVIAVLCAFVRDRATGSTTPPNFRQPTDIQAALTVVGTRNTAKDGRATVVDFDHAQLATAQLFGLHLSRADFSGADLSGATSATRTSAARTSAARTSAAPTSARAPRRRGPPRRADLSWRGPQPTRTSAARLAGADLTGADLAGATSLADLGPRTSGRTSPARISRRVPRRRGPHRRGPQRRGPHRLRRGPPRANLTGADLRGNGLRTFPRQADGSVILTRVGSNALEPRVASAISSSSAQRPPVGSTDLHTCADCAGPGPGTFAGMMPDLRGRRGQPVRHGRL